MSDVARYAGVSLGTVSHAINHPSRLTPTTLAKVRAAIDDLGFVPDRRARALAAGVSTIVGFVVSDLSNTFFLDMARGAEREAQGLGLTVLLGDADRQPEKELVYLDLFTQERVAGVLLAPLPRYADAYPVPQSGRRVVLLNATTGGESCSVVVDDEQGGYLAAQHLIENGRRRLLFTGGPYTLAPIESRRRGVARAVAEAGPAVRLDFLVTDGVQRADGIGVGQQLAARSGEDRPDGVIAAADLLALGVAQALGAASDIELGSDLDLIGYDNNRAAWESAVPISTIAQPGEEMGRAAVRLLVEEIHDPDGHRHQQSMLMPKLIVRESSRPRA